MNIFEELQTNEKGLTSLEAEKRLEKYGRNELPEKKPEGFFLFL
jgi:magnesium-transporting ATPase (P-type)